MLLLTLHLLGAAVTVGLIGFIVYELWQNKLQSLRRRAIQLAYLGSFEIVTGIVLAIMSPQLGLLSTCRNIGLYILIIGIVESKLLYELKSADPEYS